MGLFSGALEQNHTRVSYGYNEYRISSHMDETAICERGACSNFPIDIF